MLSTVDPDKPTFRALPDAKKWTALSARSVHWMAVGYS